MAHQTTGRVCYVVTYCHDIITYTCMIVCWVKIAQFYHYTNYLLQFLLFINRHYLFITSFRTCNYRYLTINEAISEDGPAHHSESSSYTCTHPIMCITQFHSI
jgi:hypothetical protein